ncbi:hypothetical protein GBAR_LOCUS12874 [Geodia barretti]|uniref:Ig-like domain-containing protein n=1 Tax=Geodia barretti TaxID=519541 RepID=A0AA35S1R1_GEOBA|nr:hypothetical protein GBAR_LOCUS12874 [Geodia barretti]
MILLAFIIVGVFFGVYGDDERSAGLRSSVFLEQPERVTVYESDNATFRCSVVNSSFSIFWLVNGFSATFTVFRERGFSVKEDPDTHTISRLEVVGHASNNNTNISCAADQIHSDPELSWIVSEVALLIVQDRVTLQSAVEESMHLIVSTETELVVAKTTSSLQTKVIRTSTVPSKSGTPDNTPDLKLLPGQASTKHDQKNMVLFWYIGGVMGLIVLLSLTFLVILIVSRKLMRKGIPLVIVFTTTVLLSFLIILNKTFGSKCKLF